MYCAVILRRRNTSYFVYVLGSMRPFSCDQPDNVLQGFYDQTDRPIITAACRRRKYRSHSGRGKITQIAMSLWA